MNMIASLQTRKTGTVVPQPTTAMISEHLLYFLAKLMYGSEVCHSSEMKDALTSSEKYEKYRLRLASTVLQAAQHYGVAVAERDVLDFGCGYGALSSHLGGNGARSVVGIDIDSQAIARARHVYANGSIRFVESDPQRIPLPDGCVDVVVSHDVFEHVSHPVPIASELYRVLRPGGKALIGTWGWFHPFAPHLFSVMPVPWAHVLCGERAMIRASRRIYLSSWYRPIMHDLDAAGNKLPDKYTELGISTNYLNKYFIRDFERLFASSGFAFQTYLVPFRSWYARWTAMFLRVPWLRELLTSYVWFVLTKPEGSDVAVPRRAS